MILIRVVARLIYALLPLDCLDRTNVVQTVVARWALLRQLRLFGELRAPAAPDALQLPFPQAEAAFRKLWADNVSSSTQPNPTQPSQHD